MSVLPSTVRPVRSYGSISKSLWERAVCRRAFSLLQTARYPQVEENMSISPDAQKVQELIRQARAGVELAMVYADDGAYATAARGLKLAAEQFTHADALRTIKAKRRARKGGK